VRNISKLKANWKTFLGVRKGRSYATSFLKIRALDFSGIDFSEIGSDQTSDNFTN